MTDFVVGQVITGRAGYVGADGLPAEVQGEGSWTVTPAEAATFAPGPDRLSRMVTLMAPATGFVVTATYDADLRDGDGFLKDLAIMSAPDNNIVVPEATGGVVTLS